MRLMARATRLPYAFSWLRLSRKGASAFDHEMTLAEHLSELRTRVIVSAAALTVASVAGYLLAGPVLEFLRRPLEPAAGTLIFTSLGEAFFAVLRIAVLFGLVTSGPVILWEMWRFVAPGLERKERRILGWMVPLMYVLFVGGMAFAYFLMLPFAVRFFLAFGGPSIEPLLSLGNYLSFVFSLMVAFGLTFEFPVALFVLIRIGILKRETLRRKRKMAVFLIFVFAAVITPTIDAVSMALLALPLWALFELTLLLTGIIK